MAAGRRLTFPSPPPLVPRTHYHLRNSSSFSGSVPMTHDQASRTVSPVSAASVVCHFPTPVVSKEQRDYYKNNYFNKEDKFAQATIEEQVKISNRYADEIEKYDFDQYLKHFEKQLLDQPGMQYWCPDSHNQEDSSSDMYIESFCNDDDGINDINNLTIGDNQNSVTPENALALAKRAVMASRKAASLVQKSSILDAEIKDLCVLGFTSSFVSEEFTEETSIEEKVIVKSKRLLERRSQKRKVVKTPNHFHPRVASSPPTKNGTKTEKSLDSNDPLKLFLWGPVTKKLLTLKEEKDLVIQIQDLIRLEEIQQRLRLQFDREPTLAECAQAVGMSTEVVQTCISSGKRSRDKMIYANFRLVVHVARQYEGKGLNLQDLLQEGSRGLIKSLERFKPKAGCKFSTYAYWWIRQSIRKAIYQQSRMIRLPENVFALLRKVKAARRLCAKDGHPPQDEEIAKFIGITNAKLETLLRRSRIPASLQKSSWCDQDFTFQEIIGDPEIENPDLIVSKQTMRHHVDDLLNILPAREKQIIQYRFGIDDNGQKTLTEIGIMYGLSKERIRQLENRALGKLKKYLGSQELKAYVDLLI